MKKLAAMRGMHAKQWEEFLQFDSQRHQPEAGPQVSASRFGGDYKMQGFSDYDSSSANPQYAGANLAMDSMNSYPNPIENYPSRPHENFSEFPRQRREDYGKVYNRY